MSSPIEWDHVNTNLGYVYGKICGTVCFPPAQAETHLQNCSDVPHIPSLQSHIKLHGACHFPTKLGHRVNLNDQLLLQHTAHVYGYPSWWYEDHSQAHMRKLGTLRHTHFIRQPINLSFSSSWINAQTFRYLLNTNFTNGRKNNFHSRIVHPAAALNLRGLDLSGS